MKLETRIRPGGVFLFILLFLAAYISWTDANAVATLAPPSTLQSTHASSTSTSSESSTITSTNRRNNNNNKVPAAESLHIVEIYENQGWSIRRGWEKPEGQWRPWTYHDGGQTLPPEELKLPDGWEWVTEWKILRSNATDRGGWRYANGLRNFDGTTMGQAKKQWKDTARRRRWVRLMRPCLGPKVKEGQKLKDVLLELIIRIDRGLSASLPDVTSSSIKQGQQVFGSLGGMEIVDLTAEWLSPVELEKAAMLKSILRTPAATIIQRAKDEFSFKGFGLTFTKSLFRKDFGMGFGIPLTPNFQALERIDFLPTINSAWGIYWPFCISGWFSISYPVDQIFRALSRLNPYGRPPTGPRPKRASVERVGMSISCRYTPSTGFFFRATPWLFILPGIQLIAKLMARVFFLILSKMEAYEAKRQQQRQYAVVNQKEKVATAATEVVEASNATSTTITVSSSSASATITSSSAASSATPIKPLPVKRFKTWVNKKTSGVGYTMAMFRGGVSGSVVLSLSPFFFGMPHRKRSSSSSRSVPSSSGAVGETSPSPSQAQTAVPSPATTTTTLQQQSQQRSTTTTSTSAAELPSAAASSSSIPQLAYDSAAAAGIIEKKVEGGLSADSSSSEKLAAAMMKEKVIVADGEGEEDDDDDKEDEGGEAGQGEAMPSRESTIGIS